MSINLSVSFDHPAAVSVQVRYARIDNLAPGQQPVFTSVTLNGGSGTFPVATNIPDGQYQVMATPVYADGRICSPSTYTTPPCAGLISISAQIVSGVIVVTYLAPSGATNVQINVSYPNGGSFSNMYVNDGNPVSIPLPSGGTIYGNYLVTGQAVCDPTSGFMSPPSGTVTVANNQSLSGSYFLGNGQSQVCAASVTTLYSAGAPVPGSVLYTDQGLTTRITGFSLVLYQGVIYNLSSADGTLGTDSGLSCNVSISGTTALSVAIPNGNGLIYGPPGAIITVSLGASGPPGGTYTMEVAIPSLGISQNVSNGTTSFTFTMPPSGSVAWNGIYTSTNSSGGGNVSV